MYLFLVILRHLPHNYTYDNVYGLFPFTIPATSKSNLDLLGLSDEYDFERPGSRKVKTLDTLTAIGQVLGDPDTFPTTYRHDLKLLTNGYG